MFASKKIDFTNGKILPKVIVFVLPIVLTNLLQMFYNAADMIIVSFSSESNAVGAIGTTGSFISLIVNVFIGFSVGANVIVARELGAKNRENTQNAVHTALIMAVLFGVVGMVLGFCISRPILSFMGNTGRLLDLAVTYTYIYFLGVPFLALTNYLIAIFRAKGDSRTPLFVLASTGLLNVGLNFFFVLVAKLSVEGVALATALSNVASVIILLVKLHKDQDDTTFSFKRLKLNVQAFKEIIWVGLPAGVQGALFSLSNMIIQSSVVSVNNAVSPGTEYQPIVNGNAAAASLESFVYTAMNAVYQGAITFTSQNIGAEKPHRIKRILYSCFLVVTSIGVILGGCLLLFLKPLLSLYGIVPGAEGSLQSLAMQAATTRCVVLCISYPLCGLMDVCTGVLRGLGKSVISTIVSLIGACLLRVVWIWMVFPLSKTLQTIFISYPITWLITTICSFIIIQIVLKKILAKQKKAQNV